MYTVQDDDLDADGISIGPGALEPQGTTFGDDRGSDLYADLRASDNMVLAGHAITNDPSCLVDGSPTKHPPANTLGIHPGIIGVSVVARPTATRSIPASGSRSRCATTARCG